MKVKEKGAILIKFQEINTYSKFMNYFLIYTLIITIKIPYIY